MVTYKILTLELGVRIPSGYQYGVSRVSGKAPRREREEQGSSSGVHPKRNCSKVGQCAGLKIRRYRFESYLFHRFFKTMFNQFI